MSKKEFQHKLFQAKCGFSNARGRFMVGQDGTIVMETISALTGEPTLVVLAVDQEDLQELAGFLMHCDDAHQPQEEPVKQESILDPELAAKLNLKNIH